FWIMSAAEASGRRHRVRVGLLDGLDDLLFDGFQIGFVDAADERTGAPQSERIGALVVVRAGHEDIVEAGQPLADVDDVGTEEADEVDRSESDLAFALAQHDGTGEEPIMDLPRLAVLA